MTSLDTHRLSRFAQAHDIALVVLFGSTARGQTGRDIDVALWPAHPTPSLELARGLTREMGRADLDVVSLPLAGWLLWQEVARDGQALYEAHPGRFREFQLQAIQRSWDANVWRRRMRLYNQRMLDRRFDLNRDLVEQAVMLLHEYLMRLEQVLQATDAEFAASYMHFHTAERLLELMIEHAAKLNTEVGCALAQAPATDYYSSFFALSATGWISAELAQELGELARLRNTLVHRYDAVSPREVCAQARHSLPLWRDYLAKVNERLQ